MAKESNVQKSETIKGVEVLRPPFRNFAGGPTRFDEHNTQKFFNVRLDEELARELRDKGWKIKELPPREEGQEPLWLLEVKIGYKFKEPRISRIIAQSKKSMKEDELWSLDGADIEYADIIVNPYNSGREFCTAWLQTGHFHIKLDELEAQYDMSEEDEVVCDDEGICYINGVRIN